MYVYVCPHLYFVVFLCAKEVPSEKSVGLAFVNLFPPPFLFLPPFLWPWLLQLKRPQHS